MPKKQKIRVARIIDRLNIGGPAIHTILLTAFLNKDKFDTILITGQIDPEEGSMEYLAEKYGVTPLVIPELRRSISPRQDWLAAQKIGKILREYRPHVIHTHKSKAGVLGRLVAIFLRTPAVFHTFHGHVFHSYFGFLKTSIFIALERFFALFTNRIITISPAQRQEICYRYKITRRSKFSVIPLGFDFSPFDREKNKFSLREKYGISSDMVIIGLIGRLAPVKNHAFLLRVASQFVSEGKKVHFLLIGDGEERGNLEVLVDNLKLGRHVTFTGWLKNPTEIYSALDIVTLCSHNEGTPVTIIEAMYCACPVVATRVGGVPDLVEEGETGFLVKKEDEKGFASALARLVENAALRKRLGKKGHEKVKKRYDKSRLLADIEQLYLDFLL